MSCLQVAGAIGPGPIIETQDDPNKLTFISDDRIKDIAHEQYDRCVSRIGTGDIWIGKKNYGCKEQTLTRDSENGAWGRRVVSPTNDHGLCALHYKYHKDFIDDRERFENVTNQIHYCQEVREDAMRKGSMPWNAYRGRYENKYRFTST